MMNCARIRSPRWSRTTFLTLLAASLCGAGCVTEKADKPRLTYSDVVRPETPPDTSVLNTYVPNGLSTSNSAVTAWIASLGTIEYDRHLLPLVSPGGQYMAVQAPAPALADDEVWDCILADATVTAPKLDIIIYRIEQTHGDKPGQRLVEHRRLEGAGVLGRGADESAFLIESPQGAEARRIGFVQWETGETTWLLNSGVNAFAARAPSGRLAWCQRVGEGDESHFELFVQGENEVYRAGDGTGDLMFPIWCGNENVLFAFHLGADKALDLVVFDTRSAEAMRQPLQRERLTDAGTVFMAFQALAGIQSPAAPDGSPRILFFHSGQQRIFEYDARWPEGQRVRGLPSPSIAAAWHTGDGIIYSSLSRVYYQFLRDRSAPVELFKGSGVPCATSNPAHPFVLIAMDTKVLFQLNLWAMGLAGEEAVRAAAAQLNQADLQRSPR